MNELTKPTLLCSLIMKSPALQRRLCPQDLLTSQTETRKESIEKSTLLSKDKSFSEKLEFADETFYGELS